MTVNPCGQILHIYDDVFKINYWYVCASSFGVFKKHLKRRANYNAGDDHGDTEGKFLVFKRGANEVGVIWTKNSKPDVIAHEAFHAVNYFLRRKGTPLSDDTDEVFAYNIQFMVKQMSKWARKHRICG